MKNKFWAGLGIFLTFLTIKVVGEPKQQNLISAKKFVKRTCCLSKESEIKAVKTIRYYIYSRSMAMPSI